MGKKKVIKKSQEELLQERESIESKIQKQEAREDKVTEIREAMLFVYSSYNNTILTLTDLQGNVLSWTSAGKIGFKNTKKGTPYAANRVAEVMAQTIQRMKIESIDIKIKGIGGGRDSAVRTLVAKGINLSSIEDITPVPHNGCRARKPRRL
ncbi:30S ribosomal protein S11 [Patescibacteria group bacterium]|nr:30S ribosomal protein S11 [Patescibacteria group bacterium]MBU4023431.1 30S ribosomal protein S11 [Patescibacteria group bacterium]MBU4078161.1 30S ribosomal protein S11 [Patescibacteria group bacterium]